MIELEISKEQENYVALPSEAIAASKFHEHYVDKGIYLDDTPIDLNHQGKGYGSEATRLVISEMKSLKWFNSISIYYVKGHDVMRRFFERFGFAIIEQDEFDETIMELHYL